MKDFFPFLQPWSKDVRSNEMRYNVNCDRNHSSPFSVVFNSKPFINCSPNLRSSVVNNNCLRSSGQCVSILFVSNSIKTSAKCLFCLNKTFAAPATKPNKLFYLKNFESSRLKKKTIDRSIDLSIIVTTLYVFTG